jgi:precorrin-6A/cobalt-precorrin-6A reductase|tara:strand:+ start:465 stop:1250 length:786 start_codon:yes stop_codon:yes gene_type:complete
VFPIAVSLNRDKGLQGALMRLLLIAGMGESVGLARDLSAIAGFEVICVTEGRAVARAEPPAKIYDGKFDTDAEFVQYLADQQFDMVVDAAHPFEFRLGTLAQSCGLPYLKVMRDQWHPSPHETWISSTSVEDAVSKIPDNKRVFVATGHGSVFAVENRPSIYVLCRQLAQHTRTFPLPNGEYVFGEGPFSVEAEMALFKSLKVDFLLLRNSGSVQGRTKVAAACALGIKVIMIEQKGLNLDPSQMAPLKDVVKRVIDYADH